MGVKAKEGPAGKEVMQKEQQEVAKSSGTKQEKNEGVPPNPRREESEKKERLIEAVGAEVNSKIATWSATTPRKES